MLEKTVKVNSILSTDQLIARAVKSILLCTVSIWSFGEFGISTSHADTSMLFGENLAGATFVTGGKISIDLVAHYLNYTKNTNLELYKKS